MSKHAPDSVPTDDEQTCWGRTEQGKLFRVPATEDMLHNLFAHFPPTTSTHTVLELLTLTVLAGQSAVLLLTWAAFGVGAVPVWLRVAFTTSFMLWRAGYNAGLGYVLKRQSESRAFTRWCESSGWFSSDTAKSDHSKLMHQLVKRDLGKKLGTDYDFDTAPIEFNSWLLFRSVVDLILVNDFTAYIVFALANLELPTAADAGIMDLLRLVGGAVLIAFNWWVKRDAHRVVKDFAWYWGDFFFVVEKNLTFDGVFEMAPHPMYSIGYAGYYGISLISNSYTVFFVSLLAHAAQFAFLMLVEEPHIKKIYGTATSKYSVLSTDSRTREILYGGDAEHAYFRRDLILFKNFDIYRSGDLFLVWSIGLTLVLALPLPSHLGLTIPSWFFVGHCIFWRAVHTFGLGLVLRRQGESKAWTKHFIKNGANHREAFTHWKIIYNFSLTMTYVTFVAACVHTLNLPSSMSSVFVGSFLLRQAMGVLMILLHVWMSTSVFEVLGDFGWFYGDFFIDEFPAELQYSGIYRYLNNPEKILGHAAFWGLALISGNGVMFGVTVLSHLSNWWFLEYVETPHMQKLYGSKIRRESGVVKTLRSQISAPVSRLLERHIIAREVNKVLGSGTGLVHRVEKLVMADGLKETLQSEVNRVLEVTRPRLDDILTETKALISNTTARLSTLDNQADVEAGEYTLHMSVPASSPIYADGAGLSFLLGEPISVYWQAPATHSQLDWIGIYKVTANSSPTITTSSSRGMWMYVANEGQTTGQCVFDDDRIPWELGVYEMRLHYADKYLVLATSTMFEIRLDPAVNADYFLADPPTTTLTDHDSTLRSPDVLSPTHPNSFLSIVSQLLPLYRRVLGRLQFGVQDHFVVDGGGEERHAKRVCYGIRQLYGIEFSWKVVMAFEPTVEKMAERIQEARVVLAPAVMEHTMGDTRASETHHITDDSVATMSSNSLSHYFHLLKVEKERRARDRRHQTHRTRSQSATSASHGQSSDVINNGNSIDDTGSQGTENSVGDISDGSISRNASPERT